MNTEFYSRVHRCIKSLLLCVMGIGWLATGIASPNYSSSSSSQSFGTTEEESRNSGTTSGNTASNPDNTFNNLPIKVSDRINRRQSPKVAAGATIEEYDTPAEALKDNSWFSNPAVYADYRFSTANDSRPFGLNGDQHDVNVGFDFETVYGIIAGMMLTYSDMTGHANDVPGFPIDTETETVQLSWYLSKQLNDWLFTGATFSYGISDLDQTTGGGIPRADFDIDTLSASHFIGAVKSWDSFAVSSTASYVYVDATWDPVNQAGVTNDFNQSSGSFLWKTSGTWYATDWIDFTAAYQMTQIVHENFNSSSAVGSDDNHWGTVSLKATVLPSTDWSFFAGVEYIVFNENYEESVSISSGAVFNF